MSAPINPKQFTEDVTPVSDIFDRLRAPFPVDRISWRVGPTMADKLKGLALAYIDSRDVQERLDEVCGPAGWCNDYPHANSKTVCRIGLKIGGEWVFKSDGSGDTDTEAEKGALSGAFKRAAVMWGVGRYLYDAPQIWVQIEAAGKSFKIMASEMGRLQASLDRRAPPPSSPPAPAPNTKQTFVAGRQSAIAKFTDYDALGEWWNSEMEQKARRAAGLEPSEVNALKEVVMAKREQLRKALERV